MHLDYHGERRTSTTIGVYGIYQGYEEVEVVVPSKNVFFFRSR